MNRLPACDKWHLEEPAEVIRFRYMTTRGYQSWRHRCLICDRIRKKSHNNRTNTKARRADYAVIPLNWTPPERLDLVYGYWKHPDTEL